MRKSQYLTSPPMCVCVCSCVYMCKCMEARAWLGVEPGSSTRALKLLTAEQFLHPPLHLRKNLNVVVL